LAGVIDTNLMLYGANSDAAEHVPARDFLAGIGNTSDSWYVTDGILYEFLRASTHAKIFPRPLTFREALDFLRPFVDADNVHVLRVEDSH
jgi:uncharacterized protein